MVTAEKHKLLDFLMKQKNCQGDDHDEFDEIQKNSDVIYIRYSSIVNSSTS